MRAHLAARLAKLAVLSSGWISGCAGPIGNGLTAATGATGTRGATGVVSGATVGPPQPTSAPAVGQLVIEPLFFGPNFQLADTRIDWSTDGARILWPDVHGELWTASAVPNAQPIQLLDPNGQPLLANSASVTSLPFEFQFISPLLIPAISNNPSLSVVNLAATSDERLVAYQTSAGEIAWQLFGGGPEHVVGPGRFPSWNQDGSVLGYVDSQNRYVRLNINTGASEMFTFPADAGYPTLAPDGGRIAFPVFSTGGSGMSLGDFPAGPFP